MTTAWSHLPNAAHIDRILADVRANPGNWAYFAAWGEAWLVVWHAAWDRAAALDAARDRAWVAARDAVYSAAWPAALDAVYSAANLVAGATTESAILALIAWDETSDYLDLPVEQVRVLAALGDQRAILMLPAVIAFERSKEIA